MFRIHSSSLCYLELGNDRHAIFVRLSWQLLEQLGPFPLFSFISLYLSYFLVSCPVEQPHQRSASSFIRHTDTEHVSWRRLARQWHSHRLWPRIKHLENLLLFCDHPRPTTVDKAVALLNVSFQGPQVFMRSWPSRFMQQKPPGVFSHTQLYWNLLKGTDLSRNGMTCSKTCWLVLKETAPAGGASATKITRTSTKTHKQKPTNITYTQVINKVVPKIAGSLRALVARLERRVLSLFLIVTFLWSLLLWLGFTQLMFLFSVWHGFISCKAQCEVWEHYHHHNRHLRCLDGDRYRLQQSCNSPDAGNQKSAELSNCPRHNLQEMDLKCSFNIASVLLCWSSNIKKCLSDFNNGPMT